MELFPAIDLREGRAVRLIQGDYEQMTVYSLSPVDVALEFKSQGASNLHVVDLDGAKDNRPANFEGISQLIRETGLFVEAGGGIRNQETVERYLAAGAGRVILGTAAVTDYPFLERMTALYGDKIAVGVDTKDGWVATHGWKETSRVRGEELLRRLRDSGVRTAICTDISRDGEMRGTNLELYDRLARIEGIDIVASGGIHSVGEIRELKSRVGAAVLGKALYTGAIDLKEALREAR